MRPYVAFAVAGDVTKLGLRAVITACLSGKLIFELEVPLVLISFNPIHWQHKLLLWNYSRFLGCTYFPFHMTSILVHHILRLQLESYPYLLSHQASYSLQFESVERKVRTMLTINSTHSAKERTTGFPTLPYNLLLKMSLKLDSVYYAIQPACISLKTKHLGHII